MKKNYLLVTALMFALFTSITTFAQQSKTLVYTIITPGKEVSLEKRATLRILLSGQKNTTLNAYRANDKAFLVSSIDDKAASSLKQEVQRLYPDATIKQVDNYSQSEFHNVNYRTISNQKGFPVYVETGDNFLDELSYKFEKENWMNAHPNNNKK